MERRIALETRGRPPNEITNLNIDNCRSNGFVAGLSSQYVQLNELSLINTGLTSLKNFPILPALQRLHLSDNRLTSGLHILERVAPYLKYLNITNNRLKTQSQLEPLTNLKSLRCLDIGCNPELTEHIFENCQHIKVVDGKDRQGQTKTYEDAITPETSTEEANKEFINSVLKRSPISEQGSVSEQQPQKKKRKMNDSDQDYSEDDGDSSSSEEEEEEEDDDSESDDDVSDTDTESEIPAVQQNNVLAAATTSVNPIAQPGTFIARGANANVSALLQPAEDPIEDTLGLAYLVNNDIINDDPNDQEFNANTFESSTSSDSSDSETEGISSTAQHFTPQTHPTQQYNTIHQSSTTTITPPPQQHINSTSDEDDSDDDYDDDDLDPQPTNLPVIQQQEDYDDSDDSDEEEEEDSD